jgi:phospholipid transport system substrate-binding protein
MRRILILSAVLFSIAAVPAYARTLVEKARPSVDGRASVGKMIPRRAWFVWPILAVAMIGIALLGDAHAQGAPPGRATDRLQHFFAAANQVLEDPATAYKPLEKLAAIRRLVSEIGDWDTASARVLGAEWTLRGQAERDEFSRLFGDLLQRTFVAVMASRARVEGGTSVTWQSERAEGDEAIVTSIVEGRGGQTFPVIYRMGQTAGQWHVRDVVFEGVSLVENYRAQVAAVLRRSSYPQLIGEMRTLAPDAVATPSLVAAPSVVPLPAAAVSATTALGLRDVASAKRPLG